MGWLVETQQRWPAGGKLLKASPLINTQRTLADTGWKEGLRSRLLHPALHVTAAFSNQQCGHLSSPFLPQGFSTLTRSFIQTSGLLKFPLFKCVDQPLAKVQPTHGARGPPPRGRLQLCYQQKNWFGFESRKAINSRHGHGGLRGRSAATSRLMTGWRQQSPQSPQSLPAV